MIAKCSSDSFTSPGGGSIINEILLRERYENLRTKLLPNNFFTNMFVKVHNNKYQFVESQLPWETLLICINPRWPPNI